MIDLENKEDLWNITKNQHDGCRWDYKISGDKCYTCYVCLNPESETAGESAEEMCNGGEDCYEEHI